MKVLVIKDGGSNEFIDTIFPEATWINDETEILNSLRNINEDVLLLKDTSISVSAHIQIILTRPLDGDLLYLCRWNDTCDFYRNPIRVANTQHTIFQTDKSDGLQAVLLSSRLVEKLVKNQLATSNNLKETLQKASYQGRIKAFCIEPNLFEYDMRYAKSPEDLYKRNVCNILKQAETKDSKYLYTFGVVCILVAFGVGAYMIGPKREDDYEIANKQKN